MVNRYRITQAREEQLAVIPGIEHAAATMFSEADLPPGIRYLVTDMQTLREAQRQQRLWVAVSGDDVVGFAYVTVMDGQAHLEEMDVHPDHGRRGVGTRLVEQAVRWARNEGYARLTLVTFAHLPWNAAFYEKHGFRRMPYDSLGEDILAMLAEEGAAGIDVSRRVAMSLKV
jgi:GNAT superfamily N-acetyltransferase